MFECYDFHEMFQVKPLLSLDQGEARGRVMALYRAWYRQVPTILVDFDVPLTEKQIKGKIKERFRANAHIKDLRVIDMLVVQGQQDLKEMAEQWTQPSQLMSKFFKEKHIQERPKDFMSKFLAGQD